MRSRGSVCLVLAALFAAGLSTGCGRARDSRRPGPPASPSRAATGETPAPRAQAPVLLMTGFEPFGSEPVNSSWEGVKSHDGKMIGGMKVVAVELPVAWQKAGDRLAEGIRKHRPRAVACFGQGRYGAVFVEKVARNERLDRVPDNEGALRPGPRVVEGGEAEYVSEEAVVRLAQEIKEVGVEARISMDAGQYLCNEVFYRLERIKRSGPEAPLVGVFVHVPPYESALPGGGAYDRTKGAAVAEAVGRFVATEARRRAARVPAAK